MHQYIHPRIRTCEAGIHRRYIASSAICGHPPARDQPPTRQLKYIQLYEDPTRYRATMCVILHVILQLILGSLVIRAQRNQIMSTSVTSCGQNGINVQRFGFTSVQSPWLYRASI